MSEELAARHISDQELTLTAISVTFQRARSVQRELASPPAHPQVEPRSASGKDGTVEPAPYGDRAHAGDQSPDGPIVPAAALVPDDNVDADIEDGPAAGNGSTGTAGSSVRLALEDPDEQELPNPIVTDANLRHYLDRATAHRGRLRRLGSRRLASRQNLYNAFVVHALHQLDHRARLQQRSITRLEAELAGVRRALAALEPDEPQAP